MSKLKIIFQEVTPQEYQEKTAEVWEKTGILAKMEDKENFSELNTLIVIRPTKPFVLRCKNTLIKEEDKLENIEYFDTLNVIGKTFISGPNIVIFPSSIRFVSIIGYINEKERLFIPPSSSLVSS